MGPRHLGLIKWRLPDYLSQDFSISQCIFLFILFLPFSMEKERFFFWDIASHEARMTMNLIYDWGGPWTPDLAASTTQVVRLGVRYSAWLIWCWRWNLGCYVCSINILPTELHPWSKKLFLDSPIFQSNFSSLCVILPRVEFLRALGCGPCLPTVLGKALTQKEH